MTNSSVPKVLPAASSRPAQQASLYPMPSRFMLPLTGLWILGLDWLIFSQNIAWTAGLATPLAVVLGFIFGSAGTFFVQRRFARESGLKAAVKALVAGIVVGIPFPIAGTAVGAWILVASGLGSLRERMLKK